MPTNKNLHNNNKNSKANKKLKLNQQEKKEKRDNTEVDIKEDIEAIAKEEEAVVITEIVIKMENTPRNQALSQSTKTKNQMTLKDHLHQV